MATPFQPATRAFIGFGGNVGDIRAAFRDAAARLGASRVVRIVAASSLYRTAPVGPVAQDDFLNAVLAVDALASARDVLVLLLEIERLAGRNRAVGPRWGPRPLDLDLLVFGEARISEPDLVVPHPRLTERRFVLEPLAEVAPTLLIPGTGQTAEVWRRRAEACGDQVERLEAGWLSS